MTVYAPGNTSLLQTISQGLNHPFASPFPLDTLCRKHQANTVTAYALGSSKVHQTIAHGVNFPVALEFRASQTSSINRDGA